MKNERISSQALLVQTVCGLVQKSKLSTVHCIYLPQAISMHKQHFMHIALDNISCALRYELGLQKPRAIRIAVLCW